MSQSQTAKTVVEAVSVPPVEQPSKPLSQYWREFRTQACDLWTQARQTQREWSNWDSQAARSITDFKRDYVLNIGDMLNRSICMAVAGGITYKLISLNKPSLLGRTRNLAVSFAFSGWLFLPELFNPFLNKQ